jgi:hypothetical protein
MPNEIDMADLIHEHSAIVRDADGTGYRALIYGAQRHDGTWTGWIEFVPRDRTKDTLHTGQETSQPGREAVEYWAGGLEPVYLEGALVRAQRASMTRAGVH